MRRPRLRSARHDAVAARCEGAFGCGLYGLTGSHLAVRLANFKSLPPRKFKRANFNHAVAIRNEVARNEVASRAGIFPLSPRPMQLTGRAPVMRIALAKRPRPPANRPARTAAIRAEWPLSVLVGRRSCHRRVGRGQKISCDRRHSVRSDIGPRR